MAASEIPIDSLLWAQQYIKNMPLYRVQNEVINDAAKLFWRAAPWRWTLGSLPTQAISNNVEDYTVTLASDFEYGIFAELTFTDKILKDLEIVPYINTGGFQTGQASQLAITGEGAAGNYRLTPIPTGYAAGTLPTISGMYKKKYTKLTETTIYTAGALVFPDCYIDTFRSAVLYYAYLYADDQRAGNVQFSGKQSTFTGQRAVVEAMIAEVREIEPLPLTPVETAQNPKKEK
tara:strand:+ start:874 stop:1572 length:699 start_codon:yes stop_codon:yes gene_type:complete